MERIDYTTQPVGRASRTAPKIHTCPACGRSARLVSPDGVSRVFAHVIDLDPFARFASAGAREITVIEGCTVPSAA